jgi:nucleoside-diphosphate kinase
MGATNPVDAEPGTLRRRFAISMQQNSVHGSDSPASADREIALNFAPDEIVG